MTDLWSTLTEYQPMISGAHQLTEYKCGKENITAIGPDVRRHLGRKYLSPCIPSTCCRFPRDPTVARNMECGKTPLVARDPDDQACHFTSFASSRALLEYGLGDSSKRATPRRSTTSLRGVKVEDLPWHHLNGGARVAGSRGASGPAFAVRRPICANSVASAEPALQETARRGRRRVGEPPRERSTERRCGDVCSLQR